MKITKHTKLSDCSFVIDQKVINEIELKISDEYIKDFNSIINNTVGDFIRLLSGDESHLRGIIKVDKNTTVYEYCAKSKHLKKELEKITKYLNSFTIPQSEEEKQAIKGVLFPSFEENMLIFCQQKFFLKSMKDAEGILLCDFLVHKKSDFANIKYEKNLRLINERKTRLKK